MNPGLYVAEIFVHIFVSRCLTWRLKCGLASNMPAQQQQQQLQFNSNPNFLKKVITGDEAWVYGYEIETKALSFEWKRPEELRPKNVRQIRSNVKVLLTVFFNYNGVVHHEFLLQDLMLNKEVSS